MKSSAVCLREVGTERVENMGESIHSSNTSPETHGYTHTHIPHRSSSHSFFLSFFLSLTLRWRGRSYARPSWATCHSPSQSGRGRTLFSGPGERMCAGWGLDSANPAGCDLVTRHFLLRNWSMMRGGEVWRLERTEEKHPAPARWNQWFEMKLNCVQTCRRLLVWWRCVAGCGGEELSDATHCSEPLVNGCGLEGGASRVPVELEGRVSRCFLSTAALQVCSMICAHSFSLQFKAGKTGNCPQKPGLTVNWSEIISSTVHLCM